MKPGRNFLFEDAPRSIGPLAGTVLAVLLGCGAGALQSIPAAAEYRGIVAPLLLTAAMAVLIMSLWPRISVAADRIGRHVIVTRSLGPLAWSRQIPFDAVAAVSISDGTEEYVAAGLPCLQLAGGKQVILGGTSRPSGLAKHQAALLRAALAR